MTQRMQTTTSALALAPDTEVITAARPPAGGAKQHPPIVFAQSDPLTLGVEIELQLIDPVTMGLSPRADELLAACPDVKNLKPEFFKSTIELCTDVCRTVQDVEASLGRDLPLVGRAAAELGIGLAATGCHPFAEYATSEIMPDERYLELMERTQMPLRRMMVYGLHMHLGMGSGDDCIRFNNVFLRWLPHLLALSASSPFWQGQDTGLACWRPSVYASLPTSGHAYRMRDWREFETLHGALIRSGSINCTKDLWWDMRPSPGFGTLEFRMCDGTATLAETLAVTAFLHILAHIEADRIRHIGVVVPPPRWTIRENKWRAMRFGLEAEIVIDQDGNTARVVDQIRDVLAEAAPLIKRMGYEPYVATINEVLTRGNSSTRQRAVFNANGSLHDVVAHNMHESGTGQPVWFAETGQP